MSHPKALLEEIRASYAEGRRIIIKTKDGADAIREALDGVEVVVLDLARVATEIDLEKTAGEVLNSPPNLRTALRRLDESAKKKPTALFISNIDGCSGSEDESGVVGRLRGEIQGVHNVWVAYSATDDAFLARHLASPLGSFFKQAVIVEL